MSDTIAVYILANPNSSISLEMLETEARAAMERNERVLSERMTVGPLVHVEKLAEGQIGDVNLGEAVVAHKFTAECTHA